MLVPRCVYVNVWALGTHLWVVVGGLGEDVAHVVKRVIDDQGARHALREGRMRAIDDRVALCVCDRVSTRYTLMGGRRRYR